MLTTLTQIFFLISNALLIPVMAALLGGLAAALWQTGRTLRMAWDRHRQAKILRETASLLETEIPDGGVFQACPASCEPFRTLRKMSDHRDDLLVTEKIAIEAEASERERLAKIQLLIKFGPALGLMGTLIPLGPALIGLAEGDIQTMSQNLVIAFATTVVGLLISLIGLFLHGVRKGWMVRNQILWTFFAARLAGQKVGGEKDGGKDNTQNGEFFSCPNKTPFHRGRFRRGPAIPDFGKTTTNRSTA